MKRFQTPSSPSRRRDPRPTARDIAVGHDNAKSIHRGVITLHIRPVKATDHIKRYTPERVLNVRAFVGGPTWCKIHITSAERVPLTRALTLANAKHAGYRTTAELREAHERSYGKGRKDRQVWVIQFRLDVSEQPRLLAVSGDAPARYSLGADGRWHYVQRHDEREGDRGYTSTPSRALRDEFPALSDEDHKRHIEANLDLDHGQWVALSRLNAHAEKARAHTARGRAMRLKNAA